MVETVFNNYNIQKDFINEGSVVNGEVNLWVTDLNENSFTVHTSGHPVQIGWIAKIKNISVEEVCTTTFNNALNIFKI